jgi:hypothetical protein
LALLQDALAEAYATHRISWEFGAVPSLREEGIVVNEIERRFKLQAAQAKDFAYGLAEQIKQLQETPK